MVGVAVAVVLGVGAVPVDAAGAFLDAGPRAPPVEVLLAAPAHPPRVGAAVWRGEETQKAACQFPVPTGAPGCTLRHAANTQTFAY